MSIPLQITISPTPEKFNSIEKTLNPLLKQSQSLKTSPPPPMSHLENFSALTSGNSLHPSPKNIVTLLKHFKQSRKKSQPPDTSSGLGSSTVDQVLKYPKYIPSTSTGQVLIF